MRRHVEIGADVPAATHVLRDAAAIVRATREWFGGGGYPLMVAGENIPLISRIIAVVDAFDAMTHPACIALSASRPTRSPNSAAARPLSSIPISSTRS